MPVLNDFGPEAYARVTQQATDLANKIGIQPEIIIQFFNDTAHFPQTLDELNRWGDTPDKEYGFRRRQPNGVWTPIYQGVTPGKDENDPGFKHRITNEVGRIQRFQQVDPSGNVWGGSFDPAYNAAHPELAGRTGFQTATTGLGQGPKMGLASQGMDQGNYVAPAPSGGGRFVSVVGGVPVEFNSQAEAEQNFNQRTGTGAPASAPAAGPSVGAAGPGSAGPAASPPAPSAGSYPSPTGGGGSYTNPAVDQLLVQLMNNAATIAYQTKRLELDRDIANRLDEREKQRLAQEAARDAANQVAERARLTGTYPDGTPTLDAQKTRADITGYQPAAGAGKGQAVLDAMTAVRANPQYQALARAAAAGDQTAAGRMQAMEAAGVQQAAGVTAEQAAAAVTQLRGMTAGAGGQQSSAATVETVLGQVAPGAATFAREQEQNRTGLEALRLLSTLRGPENAFVYANTLASMPDSIRQQIQAAMGRLPIQAQTPAQRGVLGDVGAGGMVHGGPVLTRDDPGAVGGGARTLPTPGGLDFGMPAGSPTAPGPVPGGGQVATGGPTPILRQGEPTVRIQPVMAAGAPLSPAGGTPGANPLATMPVLSRPGVVPQAGGMVAPNQLNAADVTHANPYAKSLLWAGYENQGQDPKAAEWEFLNSLPIRSGPKQARIRA